MNTEINTQVVVLGGGPGGYSAAFRCADLGLKTVLIERCSVLGGVCLNVGCIPSKTLLHIAKVIEEAKELRKQGIIFNEFNLDIDKVRTWKTQVINRLTTGLKDMAKMRKIQVIKGYGKFDSVNVLRVDNESNIIKVKFKNAIIASGSHPIRLPFIPYEDPRIWDSTDALKLTTIPHNLLVMGGGIIGLEIATIYHAFGSKIDIVEMSDQIIPSVDKDIMKIFTNKISSKFHLMLETQVTSMEAKDDGIYVSMKRKQECILSKCYDVVLVAIGRIPNSTLLDINKIGVKVNKDDFICVDKTMCTNVPNIYAVGDVVGQPMLAHKGTHEGHIAAEVISGKKHYFENKVIPSIAYTNPEIAWVGLTEKEAKKRGIIYEVAIFPWSAGGRAVSSNYQDGLTKLIFNPITNRIIGGSVIGVNGGELLGEIGLAIEMGCDAEDIALTVHAHPTLYESIGLAAEIYTGTITDLPNNKIKKVKEINDFF